MDTRTESSRERVVLALMDTFFIRSKPPTSIISTILTDSELERFYAYQGSDSNGIALKVLEAIETRLSSDLRRELYTLFWLLNTRFGTIILGGRAAFHPITPAAFPDLPMANRERILLNWSQSSTTKFRKAFVGLKGLLLSTLFTLIDPDGRSTLLETLKYQVSDPKRPVDPLPQAIEAERCITAALVDLSSISLDGSTAGIARAAAQISAKGLSIHWPGHSTTKNESRGISPVVIKTRPAFIVSTDAIVIGSGAGGGVSAARLAQAGLNVIVLEKSSFIPAQQMSLQEGEAFSSMYDYGGLLTTENGTTSVLAGSTLGGGTRINWNASFKTPLHVRKEWAEGYGLPAFAGEHFDQAVETVCKRIGVNTGFAHGGACSALAAGLEAAGMHCGDVPRNCLDPECSGHCCFGCARGAKQDSVNTFLADACSTGTTKIITGAWVESIILEKTKKNSDARNKGRFKQAVGVVVKVGPACSPLKISFSAPIVICCAGAIQTPAVMLRSNIFSGGNVGANLRLHPCTCVVGIFPPEVKISAYLGEDGCSSGSGSGFCGATPSGSIRCSEGPIMSVFSRHGANWESSGYGFILYTPATHPGLFAAAAPWLGGTAYKDLLIQYPNSVPVLVLVRDSGNGGTVAVDKEGRPRLQYTMSQQDREVMVEGMKAGLQALIAAGASSVITLANSEEGRYDVVVDVDHKNNAGATTVTTAAPDADTIKVHQERISDPTFQAYLQRVHTRGVVDLQMATFSAHQMGTARLGATAETSVLDPTGESWEVANMYCCDGSTLPTSLGINPMVTIESVAYMLAGNVAAREREKRMSLERSSSSRKSKRGPVKVEYDDGGQEIVAAPASAKL
ncbi:hypothetical protein Ndes2526B_g07546 [Nannochloris sp. 'desiccata']|nr:putative Long-chain-alcohol oxidase FAO4A [Chlorella desiccata (nom. nud.)]